VAARACHVWGKGAAAPNEPVQVKPDS
jgi:hypothetical protein